MCTVCKEEGSSRAWVLPARMQDCANTAMQQCLVLVPHITRPLTHVACEPHALPLPNPTAGNPSLDDVRACSTLPHMVQPV